MSEKYVKKYNISETEEALFRHSIGIPKYPDNPTPLPDAIACRDDWKTQEMPAQNIKVSASIMLTKQQFEALAAGMVPQQMEDKWFAYLDGDSMYFHRSWTGICIFIAAISPNGNGGYEISGITINQDKAQHTADEEEALDTFCDLVEWLSHRVIV